MVGARELYIDLLIRCVSNTIYGDSSLDPWRQDRSYQLSIRDDGRDWPTVAHSMAGLKRLQNLRELTETVLAENIPGDLIETGVWRGGSCILMRGILKAYGDTERTVIVADSFEGLPPPDAKLYPADKGDELYKYSELAVDVETVKSNFSAYGLLDDQVKCLKGWFCDTLPSVRDRQFALLRLDGDMYSSTMDSLTNLYDRLSPGGFIIVDDYGAIPACKKAVGDYRSAHDIDAPITMVDWTGAWWRKPK